MAPKLMFLKASYVVVIFLSSIESIKAEEVYEFLGTIQKVSISKQKLWVDGVPYEVVESGEVRTQFLDVLRSGRTLPLSLLRFSIGDPVNVQYKETNSGRLALSVERFPVGTSLGR